MPTHSSIFAWRIPRTERAWRATVHRVAESDTHAPSPELFALQTAGGLPPPCTPKMGTEGVPEELSGPLPAPVHLARILSTFMSGLAVNSSPLQCTQGP